MKINVRRSKTKRSKMTGFRYRNKTKGGRKVIRRRRARGRTV
jgi:ribosomal protein L34